MKHYRTTLSLCYNKPKSYWCAYFTTECFTQGNLTKNHVLGTTTQTQDDEHYAPHANLAICWTCCRGDQLGISPRTMPTKYMTYLRNFLMFLQHLTCTDLYKGIKHKVNTVDAQPVRAKIRRTPLGFTKEKEADLKTKQKKLLDNGVVVLSKLQWVSAPVLVRKKDDSEGYYVDFRKVNILAKNHVSSPIYWRMHGYFKWKYLLEHIKYG